MTKRLELEEIARRLFKAHWADTKEFKQGLDAYYALPEIKQGEVLAIADKRNWPTGIITKA